MMFKTTSFLEEEIENIILSFKESGEESLEIPGAEGIFITKNKNKEEEVIYINQIEKDGETYYLYSINPLV